MKLETITKLEMTHLKLNRPQQINARCKINASLWSLIIIISPFLPNYKKKKPLLKEYYKGEIYQHPITHNRTIILSKPPRVVNNCNASDKNTRVITLNKMQKNPRSSFCLPSSVYTSILNTIILVGTHWWHAKWRHGRHSHPTHWRGWRCKTSSHAWHWWSRQSQWQQLCIHILQSTSKYY